MTSTLERESTSITNAAELSEATRRDGVEFLFAMFVDLHGKPCAKMVPVSAIDSLMADGAGFAGFAAGPMGQSPSSPDILAMPDLSSYMPAPWQPGLGIIQCDPYVLGEPWPFAPRVILRRQVERASGRERPVWGWAPRRSTSSFGARPTVASPWPTRWTRPRHSNT